MVLGRPLPNPACCACGSHSELIAGYVVRLHTRLSTFTIEARPLIVGKKGLYSYFRDEAGVIRFEPESGTSAGAESRRWSAELHDDVR